MKQYTKTHNLENMVHFRGKVTREQVQELFQHSHLHVITSLGEATTTVLWEAMAKAIPTMTLDHCGMAGVVCEKCGIKIPIAKYDRVVNDIASRIERILSEPGIIQRLSQGCIECAKTHMWQTRREIFNTAYDRAIADHK